MQDFATSPISGAAFKHMPNAQQRVMQQATHDPNFLSRGNQFANFGFPAEKTFTIPLTSHLEEPHDARSDKSHGNPGFMPNKTLSKGNSYNTDQTFVAKMSNNASKF